MPYMRITVVIPAFNSARTISRAVESVLQQNWPSLEIVAVDDGSTDDTMRVLNHLGCPNLRVVQQANAGPAAARNRGVGEAKGEWVAFLDADDEWLPGK